MLYIHGSVQEQQSKMKWVIAALVSSVAMLAMTGAAFAHGGPGSKVLTVDPADNNCMGQLARAHAQDETKDTNGVKASLAVSKHGGFGGTGTETVGQEMHLFQDYCKTY